MPLFQGHNTYDTYDTFFHINFPGDQKVDGHWGKVERKTGSNPGRASDDENNLSKNRLETRHHAGEAYRLNSPPAPYLQTKSFIYI
jgi:hypothetical protein